MTNEEKQAIANDLTAYIGQPLNNPMTRSQWMQVAKIALSALTAQPVKLPKGFNPAIGDIFDRAAPVMRRDASDGKWLHKADVTKILNELGHEVQE